MKLNLPVGIIAIVFPLALYAQNPNETDTTITSITELSDVIVYANKFPELTKHVAQYVKVIRDKSMLNLQPNTADVLSNSGSVFVQKSQQGGGSPVIRGFEASRVLLEVDGIRLNNAIYRAGHLQNVLTVDNMMLNRLEILYGPSSTLYGSDALGGVINMYTANPILSNTGKTQISGSATVRYASAINEQRGNISINIGGRKWASLTSVTYGSFGDVVQGENRDDKYPNFGLKTFVVQRIGNTDTAVANSNPKKQSPSGYDQVDVLQKILFQPKENIQHILNLQFSNSTDIPRYDRLTETNNGNPVYAEWYYGPQVRNMAAYHFNATKLKGFFGEVKSVVSFQDIGESRISRRFKSNNKDFRWERVNVVGLNFDAKHYSAKNELHIGAESYTNYVRSTAQRMDIVSGAASRITTRYADGPTKMSYNALYAQHTLLINDRFTLNDGLRINYTNLNAVFADTSLMHFPFTRAKQDHVAVTGNIGLIYSNAHNLRIAAVISSGFRSPNVDDLSRVFESSPGNLIVPNPSLKPEYTYNAELNLNQITKKFSYGASLFYTWFRNALVLDAFTFNGKDSIFYNGETSKVLAVQNKAKAYIYGFSVNGSFVFARNTSVDGIVTYSYGRFKEDGIKVPLDHIPPVYGRGGIKHTEKIWNAEAWVLFNGWKRLKNYNPSGEDNLQYATAEGMPSWVTLNIRGAVNIGTHLMAQLAVENLLDRNYRYFASGISAPGRNFIISVKTTF